MNLHDQDYTNGCHRDAKPLAERQRLDPQQDLGGPEVEGAGAHRQGSADWALPGPTLASCNLSPSCVFPIAASGQKLCPSAPKLAIGLRIDRRPQAPLTRKPEQVLNP